MRSPAAAHPQSKAAFRQLDAAVGRLAVKLPIGDLAPQAAAVRSSSFQQLVLAPLLCLWEPLLGPMGHDACLTAVDSHRQLVCMWRVALQANCTCTGAQTDDRRSLNCQS
jgi:hypothetical protein